MRVGSIPVEPGGLSMYNLWGLYELIHETLFLIDGEAGFVFTYNEGLI